MLPFRWISRYFFFATFFSAFFAGALVAFFVAIAYSPFRRVCIEAATRVAVEACIDSRCNGVKKKNEGAVEKWATITPNTELCTAHWLSANLLDEITSMLSLY